MSRLATLAGYVIVLAVAAVVDVRARQQRGGATFGDALATALRPWPVRLVVVAAWLWLGWHLFVRVDWR